MLFADDLGIQAGYPAVAFVNLKIPKPTGGFLVCQPCCGPIAHRVNAIYARDQMQLGLESQQVRFRHAAAPRAQGIFEHYIEQKRSIPRQQSFHVVRIRHLSGGRQAVKAANVEDQVERAGDAAQARHVADAQVGMNVRGAAGRGADTNS